MNHFLKVWTVALGSAAVASFAMDFAQSFPLSPIISSAAIIGGAIWCTILELKNEERKKVKKEEEKKKMQQTKEKHFEKTISAASFDSEKIQTGKNEIDEKIKNIFLSSKKMIESKEHIDKEELEYLYELLYGDVKSLIQSYIHLSLNEKKEQEKEVLILLERVEEKIKELEEKIDKRKEKEFEYAKNVLQEKLKRG